MEGYYNNTIFHRLVKGFIVQGKASNISFMYKLYSGLFVFNLFFYFSQTLHFSPICLGGDPCGDGTGGDSIFGGTFKDEFHSRLRFSRRGLVAMANAGKDDNASQFFFTLGETPELHNKHTLFGKITGDTIYNMLKLEEGIVDHNERPLYPHKILKAEILLNPFEDIVPRVVEKVKSKDKSKKREKGVK